MTSKLRVLCLHGYTQTAQKFRDRTGPFRRSLKNDLELYYITAPHLATEFNEGNAWWNHKPHDKDRIWTEVQTSLDLISKVVTEEGPFDGILGFSQGAGMAAIAMAMLGVDFKFSILVAGFVPDMRQFADTVDKCRMSVPTLVVVGEKDEIVPAERGKLLALTVFAPESVTVLTHEGGHFLPCNAEWRGKYRDFLSCIKVL
ncbi:Family of serine hydrolases 3 [Coemansia sp. RSA 922]|nr:Family of serine hydrolases 3 [Coemansia sp. S2]KAJ2118008.1 Family of serine hydrolases 3 [Coemansia sp. RSA 922]